MEENLDEKKCPVCGRPNLSQAKKCWYCQAPLEEPEETHQDPLLSEEEMLDQSGDRSSFVQSAVEEETREIKENAPEWLRRVRELIAADRQQEEPIDDWQQQQLFEIKGKKEAEPEKTSSRIADPTPAAEVHKESKEAPTPKEEERTDPQSDDSGDLPDGFSPLSKQQDQ